jgi:hypothetical protein
MQLLIRFFYNFRIPSRNRAKLINAITVITTVHNIYSFRNIVERDRKRPRIISTNAKNVREIFNVKFRRISPNFVYFISY